MWYAFVQAIVTAILVNIFSSNAGIKYKILSAGLAFFLIYIFGYIDDLLKLVDREQKGYSERNEIIMKITKYLEEIKSKLNEKETK